MPFWLLIPPVLGLGLGLGKLIHRIATAETASSDSKLADIYLPRFEHKGNTEGPLVVMLGRTGVGKSSLINMLAGEPMMKVGAVASTTRTVEIVRTSIGGVSAGFADTPGFGEAHTSPGYEKRLRNWIMHHRSKIRLLVLVLQADNKGYADDHAFLHQLSLIHEAVPLLLVLNQADKVMPVRKSFKHSSWSVEAGTGSQKANNLRVKVQEVRRQFADFHCDVIPTSLTDVPFNAAAFQSSIENYLC